MSFWSSIKHAINSTIGTSEFKPLDEIIKGQKSLVVSDNIYCTLLSTSKSADSTNTEVELCSFQMNGDGSFKFKCYASYSQYSGSVIVYRNNVATEYISIEKNTGSYIYSDTIKAEKNDVIRLTVKRGSGGSSGCKEVYMCADMVDNSVIEIIS